MRSAPEPIPVGGYHTDMKVALLADRPWLQHEATTYRHLVVGLIDEGVRVVPIVPEGVMTDALSLISERIDFRGSQHSLVRSYRLRRLAAQLRQAGCDLLHVIDESLAASGASLARATGLPMVAHAWSDRGVPAVARAAGHGNATVVAPTEGLARRARGVVGAKVSVEHIPAGVMRLDNAPPPLADPSQSIAVAVFVPEQVGRALEQLLRGAVMVRKELPQLQLFVHSVGAMTHKHWQVASQLNALDIVSFTSPQSDARTLLVQADAIIQPEATGCVRTTLLSAMAAGRPVLAAADPVMDYLIDGQTARLVDGTTDSQWAEVLRSLAAESRPLRELGERAAAYVGEHHRVAASVLRTIEAYRAACGEPLRFQGSP